MRLGCGFCRLRQIFHSVIAPELRSLTLDGKVLMPEVKCNALFAAGN
jgi:hypothetical protein